MFELHTAGTPNGRKISIALEELAVPYTVHAISFKDNEQQRPEYLALNPNGKIPTLVDTDGPKNQRTVIFESGAILIYLADKTGKLLAKEGADRYAALSWLMFQMSGVGPMFGQSGHFNRVAPEKIPYAIERFDKECERLLGVLDRRLKTSEYLAGEYSIADIATYPWIFGRKTLANANMESVPNVVRWMEKVGARPAVQRGMAVP